MSFAAQSTSMVGIVCFYNKTDILNRGFSLLAPNLDDPQRPGEGAVCSTYLGADALFDVTIFDPTGGTSVEAATAGSDGTAVFANAFDGFTTTGLGGPSMADTPITTTSTTGPIIFEPSSSSRAELFPGTTEGVSTTLSSPISTTSSGASSLVSGDLVNSYSRAKLLSLCVIFLSYGMA